MQGSADHSPAAPQATGSRLGLVIGHSLADHGLITATDDRVRIETAWGSRDIIDSGQAVVLSRHGIDDYTPAHRLDHRANIAALCAAGCDRVLAIGSVGSLRAWPVGTVVVPFDFYSPASNPSFFDDARGHSIPGFDSAWRDDVLEAWRTHTATPVMDGGVYAQTRGPRFETAAEVRMLGGFADIVGMTIADECILAKEAGLAYAALCTVDNLANGVDGEALTVAEFHAGVAANQSRLADDLLAVLPALATLAARRR